MKNTRIIAERTENGHMNIYLICSGEKIFLMQHRYNFKMFSLLKDGIQMEQLRRSTECYKLRGWKRNPSQRRRSRTLENSLHHLLIVAEEYLRYEYSNSVAAAA